MSEQPEVNAPERVAPCPLPFEPDVSYDDALVRLQEIKAARRPGSLIRLSDGEGNVLGFPEVTSRASLNATCKIMFGRKLTDEEAASVRADMGAAAREADLVGLHRDPEINRLNRARGVLGQYLDPDRMPLLTGAYMNLWMGKNGTLADFVRGEERVGLISCNNLGARLQERLGIGAVDFYEIPSEAVRPVGRTHAGIEASNFSHYPHRYHQMREEIRVPFTGMIFLVGAGVLGKAYCGWIKQRGGIAIDAGSVLDGWAEQPTRRYLIAQGDQFRI